MNGIQDLYELSPLQQGMLFHTLWAPASGMYIQQMQLTLTGQFDGEILQKALEAVALRHPVLRTSFHWEEIDKPLQVVYEQIDLPCTTLDWRAVPVAEQEAKLSHFLEADRQEGFDITAPPLMRCALIQVAEQEYRFIWSFHHLLLDGWSVPIVLNELFAHYDALSEGETLSLPTSRPYRDYILWSQQQDQEKAERFWRASLEGVESATPLPREPLGAANATNLSENVSETDFESYDQVPHLLSAEATARIHDFAKTNHLTMNTLLQGAWAMLLGRYSREKDVVFGATVSGRPPALPGVESMVGLFINTLPVRVRLDDDSQVLPWLQAIQSQQLTQEEYAYCSLVDIQGWSDVPRTSSLFESLVVYENYPFDTSSAEEEDGNDEAGNDEAGNDENISGHEHVQQATANHNGGQPEEGFEVGSLVGIEQTNYPITLNSGDSPTLPLYFNYNTEQFQRATVEQMALHLGQILLEIVAKPQARLADISMIRSDERQHLLTEWNETQVAYPLDNCLHHLFEEQVQRTPDGVALVLDGQEPTSLSYQELNERANQLAHYLLSLNVAPETLIGVCMERSIEMVVALYGTLKAGCAYVPLDPTYPAERLAFMLDDAQVPVLLTQHALVDRLPTHQAQIIFLDSQWESVAQMPVETPAVSITSDNLAYMIYTSGSTGKPKGAMNSHRGIVNRLLWMQDEYGLLIDDHVVQKTPFSFDVSVWEFFWPLLVGTRLVIAKPEGHKDPDYLADLIQRHQITTLHFVPPMLQAFLLAEKVSDCTSLRRVICSGEALPLELQRRFFQKLDAELHNLYGPTEAAIDVTYWACDPETTLPFVPIGRPVANTQIYLLDEQMEPVPVGVAGELHIGGVQVARGYHNRSELNAEKFIPNPFGPGQLYKTGDLASYLPDGTIEFLGRLDHQVKIRGFRIELGEIENLLNANGAVHESVVLAMDERLVAYVTLAEGAAGEDEFKHDEAQDEMLITTLRSELEEQLPDYMVPSGFVLLDEMPLSPNGKIDRKALSSRAVSYSDSSVEYVAPRTEDEEALAAIWQAVLDVEQVGVYDNFFELGGHSLLAMQLVSRIRSELEVGLALRTLFDAPCVADLAVAMNETDSASSSASPPILPAERPEHLPLSFAQQRLWFLDQLEGPSATYNMSMAVNLEDAIDLDGLRTSLEQVIQRHEILRTTIQTVDGTPVQQIGEGSSTPLHVVDFSMLSGTEQEEAVGQAIGRETGAHFDLATGPLLRVTLYTLSSDSAILLMVMHHIISDGWSLNVLAEEIFAHYEATVDEQQSQIESLAIQYADYAIWQREWLSGDVLEGELDYWQNQLAGAPELMEVPIDGSRPPVQTFNGAMLEQTLDARFTEQIQKLSQETGSTPFMLLLAIFNMLLSKYSGQEDVVVGTPVANREMEAIEPLIGLFVNTLVLRTDLSGDPTFMELMTRVRETALDAYAHQDLPFEQIVEAVVPNRNLSHSPLFQHMFTLDAFASEHAGSDEEVEPSENVNLDNQLSLDELTHVVAKFDMTLSIQMGSNNQLCCQWEYNTDLYLPETVERMAAHYENLLSAALQEPDRPLSQLKPLSPQERKQLLFGWNDTELSLPSQDLIHQLIAKQAARTPDAPAVVLPTVSREETGPNHSHIQSHTLTYGELNQQANAVAHYLIEQGAKPGQIVALRMDYSVELVVAILGVLKSGSAYLPLDATQPDERLDFMIQDANAHLVLDSETVGQILASPFVGSSPVVDVAPDALAYVIYTSGSTGTPKGVMVSHANLRNMYWGWDDAYDLTQIQSLLQMANVAFDVFTGDFVRALASGAKLVMAPREWLLDPESLYNLIQREEVDYGDFVPAVMRILAQYLEETTQALEKLKVAIVGSDSWYGEEVARFKRLCGPHTRLVNAYGVTEVTIDSSFYDTGSLTALADGRPVPIGRGYANTHLYILNQQMEPTPIGVAGELYLGGTGVAMGYLNQPQLTDEKFIANPFRPGEKMYRTGDGAKWLADGQVEFLGRLDTQVKVRGFRIELGEISSTLSQHELVSESVVLVHQDKLAAYLVVEPEAQSEMDRLDQAGADGGTNSGTVGSEALFGELRLYLQDRLPAYMIPAHFTTLKELPLTPNGKIDRKALPLPDLSTQVRSAPYQAPQTETEEALVVIWQEVLGVDPIGIYDNFFELGGDSIISIQIVARANAAKLYLTPRDIFQYQTVAELATAVGKSRRVVAEQGVVTGAVPLTPIQRWFVDEQLPEPHHYNQSFLLEVPGDLEISHLEEALAHLIAHHDALRLHIGKNGTQSGTQEEIQPVSQGLSTNGRVNGSTNGTAAPEQWSQYIAPLCESVPLEEVDLSGFDDESWQAVLTESATNAQQSLSLDGELMKVIYFRRSNETGRLLLIIHHMAVDGVSWRILTDDLFTAYQQVQAQEPIMLPPKTTSLKYWAERLQEVAQSDELSGEAAYWLDARRQDVQPLAVDMEGENNGDSAAVVQVTLSQPDTTALLQDVPGVYNTQINDLLLAALAQAVSHWDGGQRVLVDLEGHGREEELLGDVDLSRTVGWFTAVYPVLLDVTTQDEPGELIKSIKEQLRAIPHQGIGYGLLRYLSQDEQIALSLVQMPQSQILFNYLGQLGQPGQGNDPASQSSQGGVGTEDDALLALWGQEHSDEDQDEETDELVIASESAGPETSSQGNRSHLLEINSFISDGELQMQWIYSHNCHHRDSIERLAGHFISALQELIAHCQDDQAGGFTPSDFPEADLDQNELDEVLALLA